MSIDELGRAAGTAARTRAATDVDPSTMLRQLHRNHHRRTLVAVAAGAVAVVAVGAVVVHGVSTASDRQLPTGAQPSASASAASSDDPCKADGVTCLPGGQLRLALPVPVTLTLPDDFQPGAQVGRSGGEVYQDLGGSTVNAGVSVMEDATPVMDDDRWVQDPSAGQTAETMASWLSKRPFLTGTHLTRTTVGDRPAWRVTGGLRPGAPLNAGSPGYRSAPAFNGADGTARYQPDLVGTFTLLDIGRGVTVIWSWATTSDTSMLAANQPVVDSIRFG